MSDDVQAYKARTGWITVAFLAVIAMLSWLDREILAMLVPPIQRDLDLTDGQFGFLFGFAAVFVTAGLPLVTALDRGNRKLILVGASSSGASARSSRAFRSLSPAFCSRGLRRGGR